MPYSPDQLAQIRHAYSVLNVPFSATALAIKQAYRKMTKRWHPDLYPSGSADQVQATTMMKVINESYGLIQYAPLRYHYETYSTPWQKAASPNQQSWPKPKVNYPTNLDNKSPRFDLFELVVRFTCGAIFGVFVGFRFSLRYSDPTSFWICMAITSLIGGVLFGVMGDNFWQGFISRYHRWNRF